MELSEKDLFDGRICFDVIDVKFRASFYERTNGCVGAQVWVTLPAKPASEKDSIAYLDPRLQSAEKQVAGERLHPEWGEMWFDDTESTHYRTKVFAVESPCGFNRTNLYFLREQIKEFVGETNQTIRSIISGKESASTEGDAEWVEKMELLPLTHVSSFLFFPKIKIE